MPRLDKFTVTVTGLGYFPRPHKAWSALRRVEPCEGLTKLAAALDEGLEHFDVRREWEAYRPHITVGRVQGNNHGGAGSARGVLCRQTFRFI